MGPSAEDGLRRLASKLNGVREQSEGAKADQKAAVNKAEDTEGKKRSEAERLHDSLGKAKG